VATSVSYLQTLSQDDAIAFVASLQKVKDHLSHELEWMNQQAQQKTLQLQGIEALLSEASELGLFESETTAVPKASISSLTQSPPTDLGSLVSSSNNFDLTYQSNGNVSEEEILMPGVFEVEAVEPSETAKRQPKSSSSGKTGMKTTKEAKSSVKSTSKPIKASRRKDLKDLLLPQFTGQSLSSAVAQILAQSAKPLHLNQLLTKMYGNLDDQDFKRAKESLANVLSTGKKQGKWQNLGEGLYQANNSATR